MKALLSLAILCLSSLLQAQVLDPTKDWFELEPFFKQDSILANRVSAIYISIQEKNDGEPIKKRSQFLLYEFNENGQLISSQKSISLNRKSDTAKNNYTYNQKGLLIKKTEAQGPFHYSYLYFYKNGLLKKEIKIDENSKQKDTLYRRRFKSIKTDSLVVIETLNEEGKPYKKRQIKFDKSGNSIIDRTNFSRGQNYTENRFIYIQNLLDEIQQDTYFHKVEKQKISFSYLGEVLDYIVFFKEDQRIKKYAILYNKRDLEQTVIERDFKQSSIRIFNFYYEYFK